MEGGGRLTYQFHHPVLGDTKQRRGYPGQTCISDSCGMHTDSVPMSDLLYVRQNERDTAILCTVDS